MEPARRNGRIGGYKWACWVNHVSGAHPYLSTLSFGGGGKIIPDGNT